MIVVVGEHADKIRSGIQRGRDVLFAVNPDPDRGMLSSLQCGLALVPPDADAAMFLPVDHPHLEISTSKRWPPDSAPIAPRLSCPPMPASTAILSASRVALIDELLALPADAKASDVIHRHVPQTIYIEVCRPGRRHRHRRPQRPMPTCSRDTDEDSPAMKRLWRWLLIVLVCGDRLRLAAPFLRADRFRPRIQAALEAALNRPFTWAQFI